MQPNRPFALAAPCLLLAAVLAGCGSDSSTNKPSDVSKIATATLPAKLPNPKILSGAVVQPGSGGAGRYTIKSGDTLSAIAATHGVTLEDLLAANPGIDPTALRAGDSIRLPDATDEAPTARPASPTIAVATEPAATAAPATEAPPTEAPPPATETPAPGATPTPSSLGQTYIVESGDFPATIAEKFGVSLDALLAANPGIDPTGLQVGDVIVIPPKPTP